MKMILLFTGLTLIFCASGCETPSPAANGAGSSSAIGAASIVGTVVDVEDGHLSLRLSNGAVEDFALPDNKSVIQSALQASGRSCRITIKEGMMEVGGGGTWIPVREITSIEWL
jgi:hypothetical protein